MTVHVLYAGDHFSGFSVYVGYDELITNNDIPWKYLGLVRPTHSCGVPLQATDGDGKQDALHDLVVKYVPEALVISDVGKERNYRLPFASAGKFVGMFRDMDEKVNVLKGRICVLEVCARYPTRKRHPLPVITSVSTSILVIGWVDRSGGAVLICCLP